MMRITSGMMMTNTKENINGNKYSVDRLNTQMSTQKKITKPSDNPLIAIKSLRLSTTLSQINQYYNNNIKDANSWLDVTETALTNMKSIMTDAYRLCVNGATDTLTETDRQTILTQLTALSNQLYAEANADYAGRTVFSGYKTNSTVTFSDSVSAANAKYQITERLNYTNIAENNYYANSFETPTATDVSNYLTGHTKLATPELETLKRIRLSYEAQSALKDFAYACDVRTSSTGADATTTGIATIHSATEKTTVGAGGATVAEYTKNVQTFQWETKVKDSTFDYYANEDGDMDYAVFTEQEGNWIKFDAQGNITVDNTKLSQETRSNATSETTTFTDGQGKVVFTVKEEKNGAGVVTNKKVTDAQGNQINFNMNGADIEKVIDAQKNSINAKADSDVITIKNMDNDIVLTATMSDETDGRDGKLCSLYTADKDITTDTRLITMTEKEFQEHLTNLQAGTYNQAQREQYDNAMIYLPDSGEIIVGSKIADNLTSEHANLEITYDKNGFTKGEVRPEMYFDCINKTDSSADNHITYKNYDVNGDWIYQNIDYAISGNQNLSVNTQIRSAVDANTYRDLQEMTSVVQAAIDAHTVVTNLEQMIKSTDYAGEDEQLYLKDCLAKAEKQMAYADDNLQKVFAKQISNFENYLNRVNLAITDVGSRGDQLSLAENRIGNQKTTFTQLKSSNEDEELSDITIDYTSAYSAYQASLQAAGKIDDMSLLDYL
ncbi:MAG: hypothetical protein PUD20_04670 [bacterium]|nr:hypothetical protein [bacterium]